MGVTFGTKRKILDIKNHFLKLNPFSKGKQANLMTIPFFRLKFCDVISPKLESNQTQILHQELFYGHNDSWQVSFQSVDVNLGFWHLGL